MGVEGVQPRGERPRPGREAAEQHLVARAERRTPVEDASVPQGAGVDPARIEEEGDSELIRVARGHAAGHRRGPRRHLARERRVVAAPAGHVQLRIRDHGGQPALPGPLQGGQVRRPAPQRRDPPLPEGRQAGSAKRCAGRATRSRSPRGSRRAPAGVRCACTGAGTVTGELTPPPSSPRYSVGPVRRRQAAPRSPAAWTFTRSLEGCQVPRFRNMTRGFRPGLT